MGGYIVGVDLGSSSIKASVLQTQTGKIVGSSTSPHGEELKIIAPQTGWAEQDPNIWWDNVRLAIGGALQDANVSKDDVDGIGIAYQMHGAVFVDKKGVPKRNAIIWCDGRTVAQKERVQRDSAKSQGFLETTLNLPGHFTASKTAWFRETESNWYNQTDKVLLPGHYILRRATGQSTVTASGLSEGIFWNFRDMCLSDLVIGTFGLNRMIIPDIKPTFGEHGRLTKEAAQELGLREGTPVSYLAGDQPNNAFSLNVLQPGEIAATAGTSAVIYGVTDKLQFDPKTRVNQFLHVNSTTNKEDSANVRIGILACINGAGIIYRWARDNLGGGSYDNMNAFAESVANTNGLIWVPYGNGPERTQEDRNTGAHLVGLDLNRHTKAHVYRAIQEGVVNAMRYGVDVMREMGMSVERVRAGDTNMFRSGLFRQLFVDALGVPLELYNTDGSAGAARGAAVGLGIYTLENAFGGLQRTAVIEPGYTAWKAAVTRMSR